MFDAMTTTPEIDRRGTTRNKRTPTPTYERSDGRRRAVVSTWVDEAELAEIDAYAETYEISRSAVLRQAIAEFTSVRAGFKVA